MKELMQVRMVENDKGEIDLLIDPDESATGHHIDQLMRCLAAIRQQFQPPVPTEAPNGSAVLPIVSEPNWFLGETFPAGLTLGLRHPSYGWIGYQLTPQIREDLTRTLAALPHQPPPTSAH